MLLILARQEDLDELDEEVAVVVEPVQGID